MCTCVAADGLLATLLEVEALDGHWLLTVPGPVDDGPTATLAKDVTLLLRVLQLGPLQKQPNTHTHTQHISACLVLNLEH